MKRTALLGLLVLTACKEEPPPATPVPVASASTPAPVASTTPAPTASVDPAATNLRPAADPPPTSAPIPADDAAAVMKSLSKEIRACYDLGLKSNPNLEGTMKATVKIAGDGSVEGVQSAGSLPPNVTGCVSGVLRTAKFTAPGGTGSTLLVPISFKANEVH